MEIQISDAIFAAPESESPMIGKYVKAYQFTKADGFFAVQVAVPDHEGSKHYRYKTLTSNFIASELSADQKKELIRQAVVAYDAYCESSWNHFGSRTEFLDLTVKQAFDFFLQEKGKDVRDNTLQKYKQQTKRILTYYGEETLISKITPGTAQDFINDLRFGDRPLARVSVKDYNSFCRGLFDFLVEEGLCSDNPFSKTKIGKKTTRNTTHKVYDILSIKEIPDFIKLANALEPEYAVYIWIALNFGLRISEIAALSVESLDLNNKKLLIDASITHNSGRYFAELTTKNGWTRALPLSENHVETFKKIKKASMKTPYVFQAPDGSSTETRHLLFWWGTHPINSDTLHKPMKRLAERANHPNLNFHALRHTYCSVLHARGYTLKQAQYLMGHADPQTTQEIYTHLESIPETIPADWDSGSRVHLETRDNGWNAAKEAIKKYN